jgi:hypothetical protein
MLGKAAGAGKHVKKSQSAGAADVEYVRRSLCSNGRGAWRTPGKENGA